MGRSNASIMQLLYPAERNPIPLSKRKKYNFTDRWEREWLPVWVEDSRSVKGSTSPGPWLESENLQYTSLSIFVHSRKFASVLHTISFYLKWWFGIAIRFSTFGWCMTLRFMELSWLNRAFQGGSNGIQHDSWKMVTYENIIHWEIKSRKELSNFSHRRWGKCSQSWFYQRRVSEQNTGAQIGYFISLNWFWVRENTNKKSCFLWFYRYINFDFMNSEMKCLILQWYEMQRKPWKWWKSQPQMHFERRFWVELSVKLMWKSRKCWRIFLRTVTKISVGKPRSLAVTEVSISLGLISLYNCGK